MARPREFEIDEAINGAMNLFWDRGYEDASLNDLLDAMAITRGSFYKAFTDKHTAYLAALERYAGIVVEPTARRLSIGEDGQGTARIMDLFEGVLRAAPTRRGCFLCAAAVDRAARDAEADKRITAMLRRLEEGMFTALSDRPQPDSEAERRARATALLAQYMGLQVLSRAGLADERAPALLASVRRLIGLDAAAS